MIFVLRLTFCVALGAAVVFISEPPIFIAMTVLALIALVWLALTNRTKVAIDYGRLQGLAWGAVFAMSLFLSNLMSVFFPQYWPWPQSLLGLLVGFYQYNIMGKYLISVRRPDEGASAG